MKITVVKHKAGVTTKMPGAFYVGRTKSVRAQYVLSTPHLANPFREGRDGLSRRMVIAKFRALLWENMQSKGPMWKELLALLEYAQKSDLVLVCHCKPLACHGDIIKAALEWLENIRLEDPVIRAAIEELGAKIIG